MADIDAVRATRDFDEVGEFNPHIRSIIAYNTDSPVVPTVRTNGVLVGQITPRGGVISGTSSLVEFDAWNYEDALYKEDDAIHINWPESRFSFEEHDHEENDDERKRQYLLSLDVDLTRIKTKSKTWNSILHTFGFLKFPLPALELSNGNYSGHLIYY